MKDEIKEIVKSAAEYSQKVEPGLLKISEELRAGTLAEMGKMNDVVEGIQWLAEATVHICNEIQSPLPECWNITVEKLNSIVNALQNNDTVLLADLLEYELAPHMTMYRDFFSQQMTA